MQEQTYNDAAGAIVFDAGACGQIGAEWFDPEWWRARDALELLAGGRGGVAAISTPAGECVLRHYRRGGMAAGMLGDRYLFTGAERTRGFAEFHLLACIEALGLPSARPIAARFRRHGLFYRSDLITLRLPQVRTLAERVVSGELDVSTMQTVGEVIARFHRLGIWHADLNVHNILLNDAGVHLIDFDRGRRRPPASAWRMANLRRLRRSLVKVGVATQVDAAFAADLWQPLLGGYARQWQS